MCQEVVEDAGELEDDFCLKLNIHGHLRDDAIPNFNPTLLGHTYSQKDVFHLSVKYPTEACIRYVSFQINLRSLVLRSGFMVPRSTSHNPASLA